MQRHVLTVRRAAAALACTAALVSLTACQNGDDATESAGGSTPSKGAEASPAAEPNGIEKLSAKEIYDTGHKTNAEAGSFREQLTRGDTKTDLLVSATECVGSVKMAKGTFEVIRKGKDVWAKPDATLAKGFNAEMGTTLAADKWLHGTQDHPLMKGFASWCHQEQFAAPDTLSEKATKGKVTTVNGRQVVPVVMSAKGESVSWYVATTGKPYYVEQESTRDDMQDIVYSDFGKPVDAQAPSGPVVEAPKE
ncbi:hypothetical protein [Streptomyces curacoi]|uniref:Lipoprotein n=1 Tax=Streptomyces curacoi TaxID=146536 RepID=A0A117P4K3_9ACTN|nr:hypothetical protein [Streptomyces curacoi]KUM72970.1 hypothetical protein AQI70_23255 [Streptomyces curacoi]